ncbi:MAG: ABC transporter substrate-binding protein [Acidimicrobiales bacterium]
MAAVPETVAQAAISPDVAPSDVAASTQVTAWPADVTSLDPANLSTNQDHELTRNIYQTLLGVKFATEPGGSLEYQGAEVVPDLAQSWTIGMDSITFHLRQGVKFYGTGDVMTADDVKWSLDRIWATPGAGDLEANGLQSPNDIHVVNPSTVTVDFFDSNGKPTPCTPTLMAIFDQFFTGIIDEKAVAPHETKADPTGATWLRSNAAGTGPYYIASRDPGVSITLKSDPTSWMPAPSYKTIHIQITTADIGSLLKSGTVNLGDSGFTNQETNSLASAGLKVYWQETGNFDMFAITSAPAKQVGALANVDVRKAIAYAMPYNLILKSILFGRGARDYSIVSPTAPEYTPAWSIYTTDLAKAKALMKAAGSPTINEPLYYLSSDVDQTNTAILIQASLKSIGITTTLTPETQAGLFNVVDARSTPANGAHIGPPGLELFNWSAWTDDPKIVIGYWATTGGINNYSLWSNPTVDALNNKYALLATSAARTAAYKDAQTIIAAAAPDIPIALTGTVAVTTAGVTGVSFSPGGSGRYWLMHPIGTTNPLDSMVG